MPRAYSTDLRERALAACEAGEGRQSEVARRYRVGERTLSGWLKLAREEGRRHPKPRRGGTRPVGGEAATLAGLVAERNDATLAEYADRLAERTGVRRSPSALCRALKALGLARKKRPSRPPSGIGRTWPRRGGGGAPGGAGAAPPAPAWWGRAGARPRGRRPGRDRPRPPRLRRRDRDRHPDDAAVRPRRQGRARRGQGAPGAVGAADRYRRPRTGRPGREPGRRRRDRYGGLPRLRRGGPDPGAARPARRARGDGRPRRPQGREGARGAGPRRPGPPRTLASGRRSRTRGCRPTRRT